MLLSLRASESQCAVVGRLVMAYFHAEIRTSGAILSAHLRKNGGHFSRESKRYSALFQVSHSSKLKSPVVDHRRMQLKALLDPHLL